MIHRSRSGLSPSLSRSCGGAWTRGVFLGLLAACLSPSAAQTTTATTTTAATTDAAGDEIVAAEETGSRTEACCQVPQFGNENIAPELYECKGICEAMVPYTTTQSCVLNQTCTHAMASYNTAYELALNRLSQSRVCSTDQRVCFEGVTCLGGACSEPPNDMSVACELTLRRAVRSRFLAETRPDLCNCSPFPCPAGSAPTNPRRSEGTLTRFSGRNPSGADVRVPLPAVHLRPADHQPRSLHGALR